MRNYGQAVLRVNRTLSHRRATACVCVSHSCEPMYLRASRKAKRIETYLTALGVTYYDIVPVDVVCISRRLQYFLGGSFRLSIYSYRFPDSRKLYSILQELRLVGFAAVRCAVKVSDCADTNRSVLPRITYVLTAKHMLKRVCLKGFQSRR